MTLPPLDDSLEDKLIIFHCEKHPMPLPTQKPEQREHFMNVFDFDFRPELLSNALLRHKTPIKKSSFLLTDGALAEWVALQELTAQHAERKGVA
jgi:hypothetical protein